MKTRKLYYGFRDKKQTSVVVSDSKDGLPCEMYGYGETITELSNGDIQAFLASAFKSVCLNFTEYFFETDWE